MYESFKNQLTLITKLDKKTNLSINNLNLFVVNIIYKSKINTFY